MSREQKGSVRLEVDAFRFWIGDESVRRSAIWRIWTGKKASDVYIAPSKLVGVQKLSLHESGICQAAITSEYWKKLIAAGKEAGPRRAAPRWRRPATPSSGAVLVAILRFPTDFLRREQVIEKVNKGKKRFYFELADAGMSVDIGIFYSMQSSTDSISMLKTWGDVLIFSDLPSGERLWVCGRKALFDPAWIPEDRMFSKGSGKVYVDQNVLPARGTLSGLSMTLWSDPKDGEPLVLAEITGISLTRHAAP